MADNRSIVITLKLDDGGDKSENSSTDTQAVQSKTDSNSTLKAVASFAVLECVNLVAEEVVAWGEYYWNRELTLNDDYIGQRNKTIALTQIERAGNAINTVASTTMKGAMFGGSVGAIVGAVIGAAKVASGIFRSNAQNQDQQDIAIRQMDAQLQFTRSRAGWSLQAASIGEDL